MFLCFLVLLFFLYVYVDRAARCSSSYVDNVPMRERLLAVVQVKPENLRFGAHKRGMVEGIGSDGRCGMVIRNVRWKVVVAVDSLVALRACKKPQYPGTGSRCPRRFQCR